MRDVGDVQQRFQAPKPSRPAKRVATFVETPRRTRRMEQVITVGKCVGVRPGEMVLSEGGPRHRPKPGVVLELERQREGRRAAAAAAAALTRKRRRKEEEER